MEMSIFIQTELNLHSFQRLHPVLKLYNVIYSSNCSDNRNRFPLYILSNITNIKKRKIEIYFHELQLFNNKNCSRIWPMHQITCSEEMYYLAIYKKKEKLNHIYHSGKIKFY